MSSAPGVEALDGWRMDSHQHFFLSSFITTFCCLAAVAISSPTMKSPLVLLLGCAVFLFPEAALGLKVPVYVYSEPTSRPSYQPSLRPSSQPSSSPSWDPASSSISRSFMFAEGKPIFSDKKLTSDGSPFSEHDLWYMLSLIGGLLFLVCVSLMSLFLWKKRNAAFILDENDDDRLA